MKDFAEMCGVIGIVVGVILLIGTIGALLVAPVLWLISLLF